LPTPLILFAGKHQESFAGLGGPELSDSR